ncbi:MAG TPA: type VI secretion system tip protein TssI/VgrG [Polyangia bacterium]|nr:type VI secretion system tip protein TssI/VgrG [Polyangia bacterium]
MANVLNAAVSALGAAAGLGDRLLGISGSFPPDTFAVDHFGGADSLGNPFSYEVTLLSNSASFDISSLVGDTVTISVALSDGNTRYFNGYVTRMTLVDVFDTHTRYQIRVEPWIYMLSSRINSRIFQHKSVPDIVKALFREHGFSDFEDQLSASYAAREYVVQYRESDFGFVSRILAHAGIYYYFRHEAHRHVLVLADSASAHATVTDYEKLEFHPQGAASEGGDEFLNKWEVAHQWRSGAYASDDFDFERPKADLTAQLQANVKHKKGDLEIFDYPAGYVQSADIEGYVRARLQNVQSDVEVATGGGDVRGVGAGNLFTLTGFPNDSQNKQYLVISAAYDAMNSSHDTGDSQVTQYFHFSFSAIDGAVPYSPPLSMFRPRVEGPQTAIVVGEAGEEISTDKYGRVKVQFHWDREGKNDENSSCWVRVAQVWAGSGWGGIHIPRIGQEVIVDFLEGDPDRPIITGRVYNADNMPPYTLPDNKTQSGIKSRSSKGGAPSNFNELRFEDKKGSELVNVQAEKDLASLVKHDETRSVGNDRTTDIKHDETITVGNNRTESVTKDEAINIGNNRTESVGKAESVSIGTTRGLTVGTDETIQVGGKRADSVAKDESVTVGGGQTISVGKSQSLDVGKDQTVSVGGGMTLSVSKDETVSVGGNLSVSISKGETRQISQKLSVSAGDSVTITSGSATVTMKSGGDITIKGGKITIQGSGDVVIKGSKVSMN